MQNRISTRRSNNDKMLCSQLINLFLNKDINNPIQLPFKILKAIPTTQKISCQNILKIKQFKSIKSQQQTLKLIKEYTKNQYLQICKVISDTTELPKMPLYQKSESSDYQSIKIEEIDEYDRPLRKIIKKEQSTRSFLDSPGPLEKINKYIMDDKFFSKINNYLSIN